MSLASLAAQIILSSVVRPRSKPAKKMKAELALFALAGFLCAAGAVLLIFAFYKWLAIYYAPPVAALAAGLALYILAILLIITAKLLLAKKPVQEVEPPALDQQIESIMKIVELGLGTIKREIGTPVQENPGTSLLIASIAGFLAARQLR